MRAGLLLIADDATALAALHHTLNAAPYQLFAARSTQEAAGILALQEIALILCDLDMMTERPCRILAACCQIRPQAIRIALAAKPDLQSIAGAINDGKISHFLRKPCPDEELRHTVAQAVERYHDERRTHHHHDVTRRANQDLSLWNRHLEQKFHERTAALEAAYQQTLDALVLALDTRERATAGHSRRVAIHCLYLGLEAGYPEEELEHLYRGALLHDIGKIGIPDSILLKRGKLESAQRRIIQQHVEAGARILRGIKYLQPAITIPQYHHERYDGQGYSCGLAGSEIPLAARLFSIIDVYDALRSERSYKKSLSHAKAVGQIHASRGKQFDPGLVDIFAAVPETHWQQLAAAVPVATHFTQVLMVCQKIHTAARAGSAA